MIIKPFGARLNAVMEKDSGYLPLSQGDTNRLLALIPEGEEMYLTIQDDLYDEWVLVTNECGTIVIDRAQDSSEARRHGRGSCVFFETSVPVIKWLICNHDCCEGPCPCEPVGSAGAVIPPAFTGKVWEGSVLFTGDTPMSFGINNMPSWMTAQNGANYVRLSGTPTGVGTFTFSVAAGNCNDINIAVQTLTVTVTE